MLSETFVLDIRSQSRAGREEAVIVVSPGDDLKADRQSLRIGEKREREGR